MEDNGFYDDLNAMPVNTKARVILEEAGEKPLGGCLHCVQAALCAIERELVTAETDLTETVKAMMAWRPQRIVNFLMLIADEEYDPAGWEGAEGLGEFAGAILDDIESKMVMHFPYYRSPE